MSENGSPFTGLGFFQSFFHGAGSGNVTPNVALDQYMRNVARCQLECQGLMSRRAQAYLELPGRVAACRTPQDLVQEQARFWQMAFQQYAECSQKMMTSWAQVMKAPIADKKGGAKPPARDYLSFPEPQAEKKLPVREREERRRVA